ncbi:hypothetical protein GNZ76_03690 [Campylobacter coli]|nr:hypothetical protein [Campylobacter coli]
MLKDCDFFYCIWDGKSKGSYANIKKAIEQKKEFIKVEYNEKEYIYYNKDLSSKNHLLSTLQNKIDEIFENNNGYSLKEIFDIVKEENLQQKIKFEDFKKKLIDNHLIKILEEGKKVIHYPTEKNLA